MINANLENNNVHHNNVERLKKNIRIQLSEDPNLSRKQKRRLTKRLQGADATDLPEIVEAIKEQSHEVHLENTKKNNRKSNINRKLTRNSIGFIVGGLALSGVGLLATGLRPETKPDLSLRIAAPNPFSEPYMSAFPSGLAMPLLHYHNPLGRKIGHCADIFSDMSQTLGASLIDVGIKSFTPENREKEKKKRIQHLRKKQEENKEYLQEYDAIKNQDAYKKIILKSVADSFFDDNKHILSDDSFKDYTFNSYSDFEKIIQEKIDAEDSDNSNEIKKLYQEFKETCDDYSLDDKDLQKIFTKKLFEKIINVKFKNYFFDKKEDNYSQFNQDINQLDVLLNRDYFDVVFSDIQTTPESIKEALHQASKAYKNIHVDRSNFLNELPLSEISNDNVNQLLKYASDILVLKQNGKIHKDNIEQADMAYSHIIKAIAMNHALHFKNKPDYSIIKDIIYSK